ncbi:MAG TPA: hypothetical protein VMB02_07760 [Candidatus Aquilonibacter sp.]|nr:hypothetical protein [Candidatus Aquilonibacter sp.]
MAESTVAGTQRGTVNRGDHIFFSMIAVLSAGTIVAGFSHSYYLKVATGGRSFPLFVHVHAVVFTSWLVLFVAQTALVARGRVDIHRKLGVAGGALAALMLLVGLVTAVLGARAGYLGVPGQEARDPQTFLIVPLRDIMIFSAFVALGIYFRREAQLHKRLMLLAVLGGLMPPGVSRLPGMNRFPPAIGLILLLFLLACPVYDFVRYRRVYSAYLLGALVSLLTLAPIAQRLAMSPAWIRFANWVIR